MKVLAGLEVTTKSVERIAEAIGAHIAQCEQKEQWGIFRTMGEPTPSWHCAALILMAALRTIGKSVERVGRLDSHFSVARPA
jgi:hypothetical protein